MNRKAALALTLLTLLFQGSLPAVASAILPGQRIATLRRGVNITNWLRFPARTDPAAIGAYLSDAAIADLRRVGFTFVRLPFDPAFARDASGRALLVAQARRIEDAGLAVVLVPASAAWHLEDRAEDRAALVETWRNIAPALRQLNADRTFPEVVNEPVFAGAAANWSFLQLQALRAIRQALPASTVILTGADWSSINGLEGTTPVLDRDVAYTFHFYDPAELTSLAAYRPDLDHAALARLPFPATDPTACARAVSSSDAATQNLAAFVCGQHWDLQAIAARIARVEAWAARHGTFVLAGEFGASARLNTPARLAWLAAVREACERDGIGWALWGYEDVMGFDLPRPPGKRPRLDPGLLGALGLKEIRNVAAPAY